MGGWRRYLELQAQAKTGLSSGLFVWALLAVVFGVLTAGFVLLIAFIWLAERYSPLTAAILLASLFLFSCSRRLSRRFRVSGRAAERLSRPSWHWRRAGTRLGSTPKCWAAPFKPAAPSAGASSFRCWPSACSPPASGWNGLGARDPRSRTRSETAAASLRERRKAPPSPKSSAAISAAARGTDARPGR
jgi:hypothetical protein